MADQEPLENRVSIPELAQHLRQPTGETGKEVGLRMNNRNRHICLNTYNILNPAAGENLLEIGMGNGFFIKDLLAMADGLHYTGADYSETMVQEASEMNNSFIEQGVVQFVHTSLDAMPFETDSFDAITTTNTLYFWPDPLNNAQSLLSVLKPGGRLVIGYRDKACMDQLEVTKHGFTKYPSEAVEALLRDAGFEQISTEQIAEPELEFKGKRFQMSGIFTVGYRP